MILKYVVFVPNQQNRWSPHFDHDVPRHKPVKPSEVGVRETRVAVKELLDATLWGRGGRPRHNVERAAYGGCRPHGSGLCHRTRLQSDRGGRQGMEFIHSGGKGCIEGARQKNEVER